MNTTPTLPSREHDEGGALPPDPAAFVAAAELATNRRDLEAALAGYAGNAVLEAVTDGALEIHHGRSELRRAWTTYFEVMHRGSFRLSKRLLAAENDWITNSWEGTMAGARARGLEAWHFDGRGLVDHHLLYSYLKVQRAEHPLMRLRLFVSYPITALRFLRAKHG